MPRPPHHCNSCSRSKDYFFKKNRRPTKISPFHMIADTQASEDSFCERSHGVSSLAIHQVILQVSCRLFALLALEKSTFTLLNLLLVTAGIRTPGQMLVSRFTRLVRFLGLVHIVHQSELSDAKQTRHPYGYCHSVPTRSVRWHAYDSVFTR